MKNFRKRLLAAEPLIGTWVKTPSPIIVEVLGLATLDVVCLDAEHAPFGRLEIDQSIAASRAAEMPVLVRVPSVEPHHILNALDCGATGIIAPHITSATQAEAFAKACRYGAGGRGYAGSTRAAGYTTIPMAKNLAANHEETVVIAQIEDLEALDVLDEIAAIEGIDCLFVGRIDLTVAYGADSPHNDRVVRAVEKICEVGKKHNKAVGMFCPSVSEVPRWRAAGTNLFLLGSEQSFILDGANALKESFDAQVKD